MVYMKKYRSVLLVLSLIILVGVVVWFRPSPPQKTVSDVEQVSVEGVGLPAGKEPVSGIDSLRALASSQKNQECQVVLERTAAEGNIEGTFFTSGGALRADVLTPSSEFPEGVLSSMIQDGEWLYVWSTIAGDTVGFKTNITTAPAGIATKEPIPLDEPIRYTCVEWSEVDGSVFIPPASITFTDINKSIEAGMEYGILPN
jgi:hypothetical protein